jgi:hypothetical protein
MVHNFGGEKEGGGKKVYLSFLLSNLYLNN